MRAIFAEQRGSVLVIFVAAIICLLGLTGLVVDVGYAYVQKAKMQNAVDAAVIAGAYELQNTSTVAEVRAKEYLEKNGLERNKAKFEFVKKNRMEITYSADVATFFMRAFGFKSVKIGVFAAAEQQTNLSGRKVILVQ